METSLSGSAGHHRRSNNMTSGYMRVIDDEKGVISCEDVRL